MKKRIYIIGAGDFGREMESWLENLPDFKNEYEIKGYLDNDSKSLQNKPTDYEILGTHEEVEFNENDYVVIAISNSKVRKRIAESLANRVNFFTYIAPNATIGKFTKIGCGSIICSNCFISTNTVIGDFVIANAGSNIGHDCIIESYCSLMANVDIGGSVILGEGVYIGTKATIIPKKRIFRNITIGAGTMVIRNLNKEGTYFGNPAKFIGKY
ncbi:acetyltransferase [Flavobacteriaceae bacterium]|nr:acetyltransferase [Flavobacteriaceae bacterium]